MIHDLRGGVTLGESNTTLQLANPPNVGQALDAGGVLSGEAAVKNVKRLIRIA